MQQNNQTYQNTCHVPLATVIRSRRVSELSSPSLADGAGDPGPACSRACECRTLEEHRGLTGVATVSPGRAAAPAPAPVAS